MFRQPTCDLIIITWPSSTRRVDYLQQTLEGIDRHLTVSDSYATSKIVSIQNDSSSKNLVRQVMDLADTFGLDVWIQNTVFGMSDHINAVIRRSVADYLFIGLDDRRLMRSLDLSQALSTIEEYPEIAAISYAMTGGSEGAVSYQGRIREFGVLSPTSAIYFADTQLLITGNFEDRYGLFVEGKSHGVGEHDMNERMRNNCAISLVSTNKYFEHIGVERAIDALH